MATALALPGFIIEAPTREEAIEQIQHAITDFLAESEIVEVEISTPQSAGLTSYDSTFGIFRDDPTFAEFVEEVNKYRQERNQIFCQMPVLPLDEAADRTLQRLLPLKLRIWSVPSG